MKKLLIIAALLMCGLLVSSNGVAKADHRSGCGPSWGSSGRSLYYGPVFSYGYSAYPDYSYSYPSYGYSYPSSGIYYSRPGVSISIGSGYGWYGGSSRSYRHRHHHH